MSPCVLTALLLLSASGAALAQAPPIATDRPGFLFSSLPVGRQTLQVELALPAMTLNGSDSGEVRSTSLVGLLRFGVSDDLELRLGAPLFTEVSVDGSSDGGSGDLEVGAKWHLLDNEGARPSFALIPSVTLPVGEQGFSAEDPVYQFNTIAEWTLAGGWGLGLLAGFLRGEAGDGNYLQQTYGVALGRSLPSPEWSAYVEVAHVRTDLPGASDSSFLGGGLKYLVSNDLQLDVSFDRGLTGESPDWLLGLGLAARF
jgi:hypothetical protein